MLNVFELKKLSKDLVKQRLNDIVTSMNTHQFDKLKSKLNKMGVFDNVCK